MFKNGIVETFNEGVRFVSKKGRRFMEGYKNGVTDENTIRLSCAVGVVMMVANKGDIKKSLKQTWAQHNATGVMNGVVALIDPDAKAFENKLFVTEKGRIVTEREIYAVDKD